MARTSPLPQTPSLFALVGWDQLQSRWKRAFRHPPRSRRDLSACGAWVATTFTTTCKVSCTFTFTGSAGSLTVTMPGESHFSDFIPFLQGSPARSFCESHSLCSETLSQQGQYAKTPERWALWASRRLSNLEGVPGLFSTLKVKVRANASLVTLCAHSRPQKSGQGGQREPESPLSGCLGATF